MSKKDPILNRIDDVLRGNRFLQWGFVSLAIILFLCGIVAIVLAISKGQLIWTIPSVFTTFFLKWPVEKIIKLRKENIALATVPILISKLPVDKAAEEIQKLIEKLYE